MAEIVKDLSENSIELPQVTAPSVTTDKLYNVGGNLTFGGTNISAGGDVSKVGTPVNNQIGVWTGDGTLEGDANFTWDGTSFFIDSGATGNPKIELQQGSAARGVIQYLDSGDILNIDSANWIRFSPASSTALTLQDDGSAHFTAKINSVASVTGGAGINIPEGVAPTSPNDGDVWVTAAGAFNARLNGATVDLASGGGGIADVVDDTSPQLGGNLDVNGYDIVGAAGAAPTNPGGAIDIIAGAGNTSGSGGYVTITGGAGGTTGGGGWMYFTGGDGGAGAGTYGGYMYIAGGEGEYRGGGVEIKSGRATQATTLSYSGYLHIRTENGKGTLGNVGELTIQGGAADAGSNEIGGIVSIIAGRSYGTAAGAELTLQGGSGGVGAGQTGAGGVVTIRGGFGGNVSGTGGNVNILSGAAGASANADGGDITLVGAAGEGTNKAGGNISITPGAATGSGEHGAIVIAQTTAPGTTTNKLYNVSGALTWNGTDLTAGGGATYTYTLQAGTSYTAAVGDFVVASNTGTVTITLPSGHSVNDTLIVKKTGATGTVTVDGNASETIDGSLTFVMSTQYQSVTLISDGTNWLIV